MSTDANGNEHRMEPTEFKDHVKLFDRTFKCPLLTEDEVWDKLAEINGGEYEPISKNLIAYVMSLQRRALFGLRLALIVEEAGEWCNDVLKERPVEDQEDELADLEYVLHGAGDTMGYNMDAARGRVAIKNHKKITNADKMRIGEGGKIIKPEDQ